MSWGKEFVELSKSKHDRDSFDCGEQELNTFIKTQAAKHMQAGISRTMVLPSAHPLLNQKFAICAFYSVAPSSISRETLLKTISKETTEVSNPCFSVGSVSCAQRISRFWTWKGQSNPCAEVLVGSESSHESIRNSCGLSDRFRSSVLYEVRL